MSVARSPAVIWERRTCKLCFRVTRRALRSSKGSSRRTDILVCNISLAVAQSGQRLLLTEDLAFLGGGNDLASGLFSLGRSIESFYESFSQLCCWALGCANCCA